MNATMIRRLVFKDWFFSRWVIAGYLLAGGAAVFCIGFGSEGMFYAGAVLLPTVLIALGIHLTMSTVIYERTEQTLPFVMSLPITPQEYTSAKIMANLLIFLIPWSAMVAATVAVIAGRAALPDGLIPFALLMLVELFASYCLILAVALVSESANWTIGAIVFGNLFFQAFLYYVSHLPSIAATVEGDAIVWSQPVMTILLTEVAAIVLLIGATVRLQARKTEFL